MDSFDWRATANPVADRYRRRLLVSLLERDSLAVPEDVHAGEDELGGLRIELFHSHLPTLERAGFVRWNGGTHGVSKGPAFDEIRPVLEVLRDHASKLPDSWF